MNVTMKSNREEVEKEFRKAVARALTRCGEQATGYAQDLCPVDTGNLRNSISYRVDEEKQVAYVGTNNEYAPYVELGTGEFYPDGGRKTPWRYKDGKGNWHTTTGQKAQPFIKPAVADHAKTYNNIINEEMKSK